MKEYESSVWSCKKNIADPQTIMQFLLKRRYVARKKGWTSKHYLNELFVLFAVLFCQTGTSVGKVEFSRAPTDTSSKLNSAGIASNRRSARVNQST